jgi:hypothetical protein
MGVTEDTTSTSTGDGPLSLVVAAQEARLDAIDAGGGSVPPVSADAVSVDSSSYGTIIETASPVARSLASVLGDIDAHDHAGVYATVAHLSDASAHTSEFAAKAAKGFGRIEGLVYSGISNDCWHPGFIGGTALTTLSVTALRLYAYPFPMSRALTLDGLAVDISSCVVGMNWRAGIYADAGGYPGALVVQTSSTAGAGAWNSVTGLATALSADTVYWRAVAVDVSSNTLRACAAASMFPVFGWTTAGGISTGRCYCYASLGSLVLPDPFGAFTIGTNNTACPAVFARYE